MLLAAPAARPRCAPAAGSRRPQQRSGRRGQALVAQAGGGCSSSGRDRRGGKLFTFKEARRIARGHNFSSQREWEEYDCAGAYTLPKNPQVVWESDWVSWEDWLAVPLAFPEARVVARAGGFAGAEAYQAAVTEADRGVVGGASGLGEEECDTLCRLPYMPDRFYKDEWVGWDDFLGK